jgi:glutathione S-transferase
VDFFKGEARSPEFRAINPMGEVPVLDADGTILTQSGVIQDWVMDETGKLCGDGSKEPGAKSCAGRSSTTRRSRAWPDRCGS